LDGRGVEKCTDGPEVNIVRTEEGTRDNCTSTSTGRAMEHAQRGIEKKRFRGYLIDVHKYLKESAKKMEPGSFSGAQCQDKRQWAQVGT